MLLRFRNSDFAPQYERGICPGDPQISPGANDRSCQFIRDAVAATEFAQAGAFTAYAVGLVVSAAFDLMFGK